MEGGQVHSSLRMKKTFIRWCLPIGISYESHSVMLCYDFSYLMPINLESLTHSTRVIWENDE
jgi:hypothetical protein